MGGFDLTFKALAERAPRTVLRLFGSRPLPEGAIVRPVERELALPVVSTDYSLEVEADEEWVEVFEAEVGLSTADLIAILRRVVAVWMRKPRPVYTTIILMAKGSGLASPPQVIGGPYGNLICALQPRSVPVWTVPAKQFLDADCLDALPWVGAAKATPEEVLEAARLVQRIPNPERRKSLGAELVTMCGLQYTEDGAILTEVRGILGMASTKDIMMASVIGKELVEYGRREGLEEGREEGREEARREAEARHVRILQEHVSGLIQMRSPSHPAAVKVTAITDIATLEALFHRLLLAEPDQLQPILAGI